jgi:hypothetical protein
VSEQTHPLQSLKLDGRSIGFARGVLLVASDLPSDDWGVIMLDVASASLPLIGHEQQVVVRTADGIHAVGRVRVEAHERSVEHTRLHGVGPLCPCENADAAT